MGYPFPKDQKEAWRLINSGEAQPSMEQAVVIREVERALAKGLHYTKDVYEHVVANFGLFTKEDLELDAKRVEGGAVGMEIFYAREGVDAKARLSANREAVKQLAVGQVIKDRRYGGHKFSKITIEGLTPDGHVALACVKRGTSKRWRTTTEAIDPLFQPEPELGDRYTLSMNRFGYWVAKPGLPGE